MSLFTNPVLPWSLFIWLNTDLNYKYKKVSINIYPQMLYSRKVWRGECLVNLLFKRLAEKSLVKKCGE